MRKNLTSANYTEKFTQILETIKSGSYWDDTAQAIVSVDVHISSTPSLGIHIAAKCDFGMYADESIPAHAMDNYVSAFKDFYSGAAELMTEPFDARCTSVEFKTGEGGKVNFHAYLNENYMFFDTDRLDKIDAANPYLAAMRLVKQKDSKLIFVPWLTPVAKDGKYSVDDINVLPASKTIAISVNFVDLAFPSKTLKTQVREAVAPSRTKGTLMAGKSSLTGVKPKKA